MEIHRKVFNVHITLLCPLGLFHCSQRKCWFAQKGLFQQSLWSGQKNLKILQNAKFVAFPPLWVHEGQLKKIYTDIFWAACFHQFFSRKHYHDFIMKVFIMIFNNFCILCFAGKLVFNNEINFKLMEKCLKVYWWLSLQHTQIILRWTVPSSSSSFFCVFSSSGSTNGFGATTSSSSSSSKEKHYGKTVSVSNGEQ